MITKNLRQLRYRGTSWRVFSMPPPRKHRRELLLGMLQDINFVMIGDGRWKYARDPESINFHEALPDEVVLHVRHVQFQLEGKQRVKTAVLCNLCNNQFY
jgi:hypothetical protein